MSIDKTIRTLAVLGETIKDELTAEKKDDMSEVHLIAVSAEDYHAITDAVAALRTSRPGRRSIRSARRAESI